MSEDAVFRALADATRRRMLDRLHRRPGLSVGELCGGFDMSRIGAMKHLAILEEAGLVISERDGRTRRLYLNAVPIQRIHERWTSRLTSGIAAGLTALERDLARKGGRRG